MVLISANWTALLRNDTYAWTINPRALKMSTAEKALKSRALHPASTNGSTRDAARAASLGKLESDHFDCGGFHCWSFLLACYVEIRNGTGAGVR